MRVFRLNITNLDVVIDAKLGISAGHLNMTDMDIGIKMGSVSVRNQHKNYHVTNLTYLVLDL